MTSDMKKIIYTILAVCLTASCAGLDQYPVTDASSKDVYKDAASYQSVLGGIYTTFIQRSSDVSTESRSQNYFRVLWMFQDASTDALDDVWHNGESLADVNGLSWTAGDPWVSAMYYHIYKIVAMSNEFIRNCSEEALSGFDNGTRETISVYRNEARFLRAYAYAHALDFYYKMPFVTENDGVGSYVPEIYDRKQMFGWLTAELADLAEGLPDKNYGHANKYAAYALLARLYLNSHIYLGESIKENYDKCIEYCKSVEDGGGYSLEADYAKLFNADNHLRTNEIIFAFACDGTHTVTWDATTFITCGSVLSDFADYEKVYGTEDSGYWNCLRARPDLVDAFSTGDTRAKFISYDRAAYPAEGGEIPEGYEAKEGDTEYVYRERSKDITGHDETESGYRVYKWTNLDDNGASASFCGEGGGSNTDIPVFRMADVYLMIAEAVLRGGTYGDVATRLDGRTYLNKVRHRAFGSETAGEISDADYTEDTILAERLREFYMEGIRRTDLIRFGKYTSGYNWQWKGGVKDGKDVTGKYNYLPVPEAELSANPGLAEANSSLGY